MIVRRGKNDLTRIFAEIAPLLAVAVADKGILTFGTGNPTDVLQAFLAVRMKEKTRLFIVALMIVERRGEVLIPLQENLYRYAGSMNVRSALIIQK